MDSVGIRISIGLRYFINTLVGTFYTCNNYVVHRNIYALAPGVVIVKCKVNVSVLLHIQYVLQYFISVLCEAKNVLVFFMSVPILSLL